MPVEMLSAAIHSICLKNALVSGTSANVGSVGASKVSPGIRNRNAAIACLDTASEGLYKGFPDGWTVPVEISLAAIHSTCVKNPLVVGTSAKVTTGGGAKLSPDNRYKKADIACRDTASEGLYRGLPVGWAVPVEIPDSAIHSTYV